MFIIKKKYVGSEVLLSSTIDKMTAHEPTENYLEFLLQTPAPWRVGLRNSPGILPSWVAFLYVKGHKPISIQISRS